MRLARKPYMDIIDRIEVLMQENPLHELPIKHYFMDGMYIREIFIPEGCVLTSLIHLTEHPYIVSMGEINIITQDNLMSIKAPYTGKNKAGTRRLGFAVTDTIWSTIHSNPDNCTDLSIIEKRLYRPYKNKYLNLPKKEMVQ